MFVLAQNKDIVKRKRITYHVVNIAVADTLYGLGMFCSFMLLLAIIMIVMCLPSSLLGMIIHACYVYKLHCNLHANSTIIDVLFILQNLNLLVNPLAYIWKDRIYRNAFYCTFKIFFNLFLVVTCKSDSLSLLHTRSTLSSVVHLL